MRKTQGSVYYFFGEAQGIGLTSIAGDNSASRLLYKAKQVQTPRAARLSAELTRRYGKTRLPAFYKTPGFLQELD